MYKKLKAILPAMCAIALTGCGEQAQEERQQHLDDISGRYIKTVNYKGHSYILYSEYRTGGGITHDPDCPCRGGKEGPMTKYYFISYTFGLSGRSIFGHCLMKVVDSDITGMQKMIMDANNVTAPPVILCLKDLSKEEYEMLKGGE